MILLMACWTATAPTPAPHFMLTCPQTRLSWADGVGYENGVWSCWDNGWATAVKMGWQMPDADAACVLTQVNGGNEQ